MNQITIYERRDRDKSYKIQGLIALCGGICVLSMLIILTITGATSENSKQINSKYGQNEDNICLRANYLLPSYGDRRSHYLCKVPDKNLWVKLNQRPSKYGDDNISLYYNNVSWSLNNFCLLHNIDDNDTNNDMNNDVNYLNNSINTNITTITTSLNISEIIGRHMWYDNTSSSVTNIKISHCYTNICEPYTNSRGVIFLIAFILCLFIILVFSFYWIFLKEGNKLSYYLSRRRSTYERDNKERGQRGHNKERRDVTNDDIEKLNLKNINIEILNI